MLQVINSERASEKNYVCLLPGSRLSPLLGFRVGNRIGACEQPSHSRQNRSDFSLGTYIFLHTYKTDALDKNPMTDALKPSYSLVGNIMFEKLWHSTSLPELFHISAKVVKWKKNKSTV